MSSDRLFAPVDFDIQSAIRAEREKIADAIQLYPLDGFCYDTNNHGEIVRLRDTLAEAVRKSVPKGERIR